MDIIDIEAPHGPAWVFLVVFVVLVIGPAVMERAKLPGLIGLLVGGYLIGPNGLGAVTASNTTVPDLGTLGLLYLMFMAGLELDLGLLARSRRTASIFTVLTFGFPMALGVLVGVLLDYGTAASLLLGSLLASHTLITYPIIRRAGLAGDPATAAAIGATVGCDTMSLVVLAAVAGSAAGEASGGELALQIGLGLVILVVACVTLLPRIARLVFASFGTEPAVRYTFAVAAFLAAGVLAEMLGIEHIVGAFFAGLALNRLIPNEGPLMHRVEFFGSAVFIPVFLVSVGLIMDPTVMVEPETLGLAALFCLACLGGKALAAAAARPLFGFSWPQIGIMYSLSSPQAAATLAATIVGFEIGLFGTRVVNAILVVILVSVVAASAIAPAACRRMARAAAEDHGPGHHVLVVLDGARPARPLVALAGRVAYLDSGRVSALLVVEADAPPPDDAALADLERDLASSGIDCALIVRADDSRHDGIAHTARSERASLIVMTPAALPDRPGGIATMVVDADAPGTVELHDAGDELDTRLASLGLRR